MSEQAAKRDASRRLLLKILTVQAALYRANRRCIGLTPIG
jgi:hypothetical protein